MSQEDRRTQVYILVCRNPEGEIIVPAFSAFDTDEAWLLNTSADLWLELDE